MAHSRLQVALLFPVKGMETEDILSKPIPIYEGSNIIGRNDLPGENKQLSRKHISIEANSNGSFEITMEGQNPVILSSANKRRKLLPKSHSFLSVGDILELLPGKHLLRLTEVSRSPLVGSEGTVVGQCVASISKNHSIFEGEEESHLLKRKRQEQEDEAIARAMQAVEDENICANQFRGSESTRGSELRTEMSEQQCSSSTFQLLKVNGLPKWANAGCVGIHDVIKGNISMAILSNYMVDLDWLLSACPLLSRVPNVVVIHGESSSSLEYLQSKKPSNWQLHKPPLPISYGTHHSKAMFLIYPTGVRIVIHTANLIYIDWNNKTQGLWMQDFPYKNESSEATSPFEKDFVDYLEALKWPGCVADLPMHGNVRVNAAFFRKFDYAAATVRLIASVPGYHQGRMLNKWGHTKLRAILEEQQFDEKFVKSPLVYQFSSIGSLDAKWLDEEFTSSMSMGSTHDHKKLGIGSFKIIWPTVENVRTSIEGYAAGNALPSPLKNVEKGFLQKYWAHWQADQTGRSRVMPHIKTYLRYQGQNVAWFLLTSSNLSKAAWGALQKNGTQLMIRSYELGVLFLPSLATASTNHFSCVADSGSLGFNTGNAKRMTNTFSGGSLVDAKLHQIEFVATKSNAGNLSECVNSVHLPVPYKLPPESYGSQDVPWSWDRRLNQKDVYGEMWPRSVQLYGTKQN